MTEKKKNQIINRLIKDFDFDIVHKAMVINNWWWAGTGGKTPTIEQLKAEARRLIRSCLDNNYGYTAIGGFVVEKEDDVYCLKFVLESNYAW